MPNAILLLLILLDAFVCFSVASVVSDSPAAAPTSNNGISGESQPPLPRKLGKFHQHKTEQTLAAPNHSPIAAPQAEKKAEEINSPDQKVNEEVSIREGGHEILLKKHHHGVDKSVAGGGVILGGLATTFLVAVFCYIRATTRHKAESST